MMGKDCSKCFERKPLGDFYKHAKGYDGRMAKCKECHKAAMKRNRLDNPAVQARERERAKLPHRRAKATADVKRWRRENPDLYRAQNAISNAVRDGKIERVNRCACGSTENVFGIPADVARPLDWITWRCALCHHRGRFAATPAEERAQQ